MEEDDSSSGAEQMDWIVSQEAGVRVGAFACIFLLMIFGERWRPRRPIDLPRRRRWIPNLTLMVLGALGIRLALATAAVGVAILAEERSFGLLQGLELPAWVAVPAAILALDLTIYLQHVLFHTVPALWRLHRVHHADGAFDVTTGVRFHPVEILISMLIKMAAVAALGAPPVAVILFEVILNAASLFNHGNLFLPLRLDRALRWLVVTPDMHRIHHSTLRREHDRNFGFSLSWWDRLLGTYRDQPSRPQERMPLGLTEAPSPEEQTLWFLLVWPFTSRKGSRRSDASRDLSHRAGEHVARDRVSRTS